MTTPLREADRAYTNALGDRVPMVPNPWVTQAEDVPGWSDAQDGFARALLWVCVLLILGVGALFVGFGFGS